MAHRIYLPRLQGGNSVITLPHLFGTCLYIFRSEWLVFCRLRCNLPMLMQDDCSKELFPLSNDSTDTARIGIRQRLQATAEESEVEPSQPVLH